MRLVIFSILLFAAVLTGWFVAEPWLVRHVRNVDAARPDFAIAEVQPQPETDRLGLHLQRVQWQGEYAGADLPSLDLWVTPLAPFTLRADLPDQAVITDQLGTTLIESEDARLSARVSLFGAELRRADLSFASVTVDRLPLAAAGKVTARHVGTDGGPDLAQGGYDLDLNLRQPNDQPLAEGRVRVWLDQPLDVDALSQPVPPQVAGFRTDGLTIGGAGFSARIVGQLHADADGRAEGRLAIYSRDAEPVIDAAIAAGLIPENVRVLAATMLNRIGRMDFATDATDAEMRFPDPEDGELRLPLEMRNGRMFLGGIRIGDAIRLTGG